jgi:uncharacterized damage-inducible protein DinB
MTIERLFGYSDRCRTLLGQTLAAAGDDVLHRPISTLGKFDSIARLLAHMNGSEERWVVLRLQNLPLPVPYEERAAATLDGLLADAVRLRAQTVAFWSAQAPQSLTERRTVTVAGATRSLSVEDCLFHVLHHESWHRAQISMALQQFGIDPPNFDFCLLADP